MCRYPVGDGAKRTRTIFIFSVADRYRRLFRWRSRVSLSFRGLRIIRRGQRSRRRGFENLRHLQEPRPRAIARPNHFRRNQSSIRSAKRPVPVLAARRSTLRKRTAISAGKHRQSYDNGRPPKGWSPISNTPHLAPNGRRKEPRSTSCRNQIRRGEHLHPKDYKIRHYYPYFTLCSISGRDKYQLGSS